jgi:hypothetical protein
MFVGFSLTDPDFHRILYDVRSAFRPPAGKRFATSLQLTAEPLLKQLWGEDLDILPMGTDSIPEAARTLDIFLDRLGLEATTGREHLLDPRYAGALDDDERQVADALRAMVRTVSSEVRASRAWEPVDELLQRLGDTDGPPG